MNKYKNIFINFGILAMIIVLGVSVYFIVTEESFDDRTEATELEQTIMELQADPTDIPEDTEPTMEPDCMLGDLNCDGEITMRDFALFREDMEKYEQDGWSEELSRSDFNQDQRIDERDYEIFVSIWEDNF